MKKLLWLAVALLFAAPSAFAACALTAVQPAYSYATLPGSQRQIIVSFSGCASANITNVQLTGTDAAITVDNAAPFTVGKTVQLTVPVGYPFDTVFQMVTLPIASISGNIVHLTYTNPPFNIGSSALSGTMKQLSLINWSTTSGTLGCTSNCLPTVLFTTDSTAGNITTVEPASPYPGGGYTLQSTHTMTVTATAVDGGATATFTFYQAAKRTKVYVQGAGYTQAFQGQQKPLFSSITGNTDQRVVWSITTQPVGGDGTLLSTNKRNTAFSATVAGRYKVTATSVDDNTKSDYVIIDVAGAKPSYYGASPDKVEPEPCFQSASMTGNVYDVGPTHTYTTLNAVPWQTLPQGSTIRIFNEDTSGTSPTTYHEYLQLTTLNTSDQPMNFCGIPDSAGHMPVLSGQNAHAPSYWSNIFLYGAGLINAYMVTNSSDPSGSFGPSHIRFAGIKVINVNPNYNGFKTDGTTTFAWGGDAFNIREGYGITMEGVACDTTSQCWATYSNANAGFGSISQNVFVSRSYSVNEGIPSVFTSHPAYLQNMNGVTMEETYIDLPITGDGGSCIKIRAQHSIVMNNFCALNYARAVDWVEAQDDGQWIGFNYIMQNGGVYNVGQLTDLNLGAAYQESQFSDWAMGNVFKIANIHYLADHADDGLNALGTNAKYGQLTFAFNTVDNEVFNFDTSWQSAATYYMAQRFLVQNNIIWNNSTSGSGINNWGMYIGDHHTNLFNSTPLNLSSPQWGVVSSGFDVHGWSANNQITGGYDYQRPVDTHQTGYSSAQFLTTASQPYNSSTFAATGAAIGAASAATGDVAQFALLYNAVTTPGLYTARVDLTTVGAKDPAGAPTLSSIAVTPNPLAIIVGGIGQLTATCTYSDSSTLGCTNSCTWTNGGSSAFHMDGTTQGQADGDAVGSGTATCTITSISGNATVNVSAAPPKMSGGIIFGGPTKLVIH